MAAHNRAPPDADGGKGNEKALPSVEPGLTAPAQSWPRGTWLSSILRWLAGTVILVGVIVLIFHFGDVQIFVLVLRHTKVTWLMGAIACQAATYACAAAIWFRSLQRADAPQRFITLLKLALVELFSNQAVPSAGFSGSLMVVNGLTRRGVATPTVVAGLLVNTLSYYLAFLVAGLIAIILLWEKGGLTATWRSIFAVFVLLVVSLTGGILFLAKSRGNMIPPAILRLRAVAYFADLLSKLRNDMLADWRLAAEAVAFQAAIFLLDAATLWCTAAAVGLTADFSVVFVSFVLASVVAMLSPLPLGLGSFEGACVGLLHLLGGGLEASLAATLLLRGLTLWLPMLPGLWAIRQELRQANEGG